jgi:hypothetical protein
MRPRSSFAVLVSAALALGSACTKRSEETPPAEQDRGEREAPPPVVVDPSPSAEPPERVQAPRDSAAVLERGAIVATLQIPSGTTLADLSRAADNIQPGIAQVMRSQAPALLRDTIGVEFEGAKLSGCISLLLVDPEAHELPLALLVEVEDLEALREAVAPTKRELRERDDLALIGPPAVVAAVEQYAFEHLRSAPDHSELVLYPAPAAKLLAPQLRTLLAQMKDQGGPTGPATVGMLESFGPVFEDLIAQTDRVVVSVAASSQSTDLFIRVYPRPSTELQGFVAAQAPASHELLGKLPTADPALVISGAFRAGAAADSILDASAAALAGLFQSELGTDAWATRIRAWTDTVDGRLAFSVEFDGSDAKIWAAYGSSDEAATRAAWRGLMETIAAAKGSELIGMTTSVQYQRDVAEHDGVSIDRYRSIADTSQLPADIRAQLAATGQSLDQRYEFAVFDGMMAGAPEGETTRLIDAARGKQPGLQLSGRAALAMTNSTALGESVFYFADFARFDPRGTDGERPFAAMVMALGKHGDALSLHISLLE